MCLPLCSPLMHLLIPRADEEPFLIFANRYYLRKLNLDGSNYTLLKQVRSRRGAPALRGWGLQLGLGGGPAHTKPPSPRGCALAFLH